MRATQTFVNIAQLTSREALWNSGESQPPHSPIAEVRFLCHFRLALMQSVADPGCGERGGHPTIQVKHVVQARSQPARWGGSELGWVEHQAHPPPLDIVRVTSSIWKTPPLLDIHKHPPLGHCPCDVINLKNAPTLGHSQAPPPWTLPVWRHPHIPRVEQNC